MKIPDDIDVVSEVTRIYVQPTDSRDVNFEIHESLGNRFIGGRVKDQDWKFLAIPVGSAIPTPSKNPDAKQFGNSKEEVIEKMLSWLSGKTYEEIFPKSSE